MLLLQFQTTILVQQFYYLEVSLTNQIDQVGINKKNEASLSFNATFEKMNQRVKINSILIIAGVFSIEWKTLGHILCVVSLSQTAVSIGFSPTNEYLAVGYSFTYSDNLKMADIIAVQQEVDAWKDLNSCIRPSPVAASLIDPPVFNRQRLITVNCIKWIPVPGQGLVYGNSLGEIKFVSQKLN